MILVFSSNTPERMPSYVLVIFVCVFIARTKVFTLNTNFSAKNKINKPRSGDVRAKFSCDLDIEIRGCEGSRTSGPKLSIYRDSNFIPSIRIHNKGSNCYGSPQKRDIRFHWQVFSVDNEENQVDENFDQIYLYKGNSLFYGNFNLNLTIEVVYADIKLEGSSSCYFEVIPTVSETIVLGGNQRTIYNKLDMHFEVLTLVAPGIVEASDKIKVLYSWYCSDSYDFEETLRVCSQIKTSESVRIIPGPFYLRPPINFADPRRIIKKYFFSLIAEVTQDFDYGEKSIHYDAQNVEIQITDIPSGDIGILCLMNCGETKIKSNPREIIHLEVKFHEKKFNNISLTDVPFEWYYIHPNSSTPQEFPINSRVNDSGTKENELRIKEDFLDEGNNYQFIAKLRNRVESASIQIQTARLPSDVSCTSNPRSGISGVTEFSIYCHNRNMREELPILYEFINRHSERTAIGQNTNIRHLGFSLSGTLKNVVLSREELIVRITNFFGAYVETKVNIMLSPPPNLHLLQHYFQQQYMIIDQFNDDCTYLLNIFSAFGDVYRLLTTRLENNLKMIPFVLEPLFECISKSKHITSAIMGQNILSGFICRILDENISLKAGDDLKTVKMGYYMTVSKLINMLSRIVMETTSNYNSSNTFMTTKRLRDIAFSILKCSNTLLIFKGNSTVLEYALKNQLKVCMYNVVKSVYNIMFAVASHQRYAINDYSVEGTDVSFRIQRLLNYDLKYANTSNKYDLQSITNSKSFGIGFQINVRMCVGIIIWKTNPYWWSNGNEINTDVQCLYFLNEDKRVVNLLRKELFTFRLPIHKLDLGSISGTVKQPSPNASPDVIDFLIAVHRIYSEPRSMLFVNFTHIQNDSTLRVIFVEGKRPDYEYMSKSKIITTNSSVVTFRMVSNRDDFIYIGILPGSELKGNMTVNYNFTYYGVVCKTWEYAVWLATNRCRPSPGSTKTILKCVCSFHNLKIGGQIFTPSHIFNPFSDIPIFIDDKHYIYTLIFFIIILALYVTTLVWARRNDKADKKKLYVMVLDDNDPRDSYAYLVGVFTGARVGAGTTSNVGIRLFGDNGISKPHILGSQNRSTLKFNSDDWFILFTHHHLGSLTNIQIWSDYSGKNPDWYCSKVIIFDITNYNNEFFYIESWFGKNIPQMYLKGFKESAVYSETNKISRIVSENLFYGFTDLHYWMSVFLKHPRSPVERTQRLSLLMAGFMMSAFVCLLSIIYSTKFTDREDSTSFYISSETVVVALISSLLGGVVTLTSWKYFQSSFILVECPFVFYTNRDCVDIYHLARRISNTSIQNPGWLIYLQSSIERYIRPVKLIPLQTPQHTSIGFIINKSKSNITFFLCNYVILLISLISFFSTIHFGKNKVKIWLTSVVISVIFSAFVILPVKICFTACLLGANKIHYFELMTYTIRLQTIIHSLRQKYTTHFKLFLLRLRNLDIYKPPTLVKLMKLEPLNKRFILFSMVSYTVLCAIFLGIMIFLIQAYTIDDYFFTNNSICIKIASKDTCERVVQDITKDIMVFLNALEIKFIPTLYEQYWYNKENMTSDGSLVQDQGWIKDSGTSRLLGTPRLRQFRIKPDSKSGCSVPSTMANISKGCLPPLTVDSEDRGNYGVAWTQDPVTHELFWLSPWEYSTPDFDLMDVVRTPSGYRCHSGGYIATLHRNIYKTKASVSSLLDTNWIDEYTRVLIFEFISYNGNKHIFTRSNIITEVLPVGSVKTKYYFKSLSLSNPTLPGVLLGFIGLIFAIQFFYLANITGCANFFSSFWNLFDCFILGIFIMAAVSYIMWTQDLENFEIEVAKQGQGAYYSNGNIIGYQDAIKSNIGMLFCLVLMRLLKIIRFSTDIRLYVNDLLASKYEMFSAVAICVFYTFIQFRFIMFFLAIPPTYEMKNILILKSDFKERVLASQYNQWLGKVLTFILNATSQLAMVSLSLSEYQHYKQANEAFEIRTHKHNTPRVSLESFAFTHD